MQHVDLRPSRNIKYDLPAGLVVFLVALPLCLGIALASGAPPFSGILAGIIGGLIVPFISRSSLSVSGPAAGLTAIILAGIAELGDFRMLLAAIVIGGALQLVMGTVKLGSIAYFFPSSVIKGMLAAIGLILITKQLPLALGYDAEHFNVNAFLTAGLGEMFHKLVSTVHYFQPGTIFISLVSVFIMVSWERTKLRNLAVLPPALVVVVLGIFINLFFSKYFPSLALDQSHMVHLPKMDGFKGLAKEFSFPLLSAFKLEKVWILGVTIGLVASVETLLSLEAVDQIDPYKRRSPLNRELIAQGLANVLSGLLGSLPVTAVIVRSSANVAVGGRTKMSAVFHGIFLLLAVVFIAPVLNMIPIACLASILIMVGYKLAKPSLFKKTYRQGWSQFLPFLVTLIAILFTDLLIGITIGLAVGIFYVIQTNFRSAIKVQKEDDKYVVRLRKDVSFLNKATLVRVLDRVPADSTVLIDGSRVEFIDHDIQEIIDNFRLKSDLRGIRLEVRETEEKHLKRRKKEHAEVYSKTA